MYLKLWLERERTFIIKIFSRFGSHPLYDSSHSSTKLLILIDSDLSSYSATCSPVPAAIELTRSETHHAVAAVEEIIVILNDAPTKAAAVKLNPSALA